MNFPKFCPGCSREGSLELYSDGGIDTLFCNSCSYRTELHPVLACTHLQLAVPTLADRIYDPICVACDRTPKLQPHVHVAWRTYLFPDGVEVELCGHGCLQWRSRPPSKDGITFGFGPWTERTTK